MRRRQAKEYLRKKREEVIAEREKDGDGKLSVREIAGEDQLISREEFAAMPVFAERDPDKVAKLFGFLDRDDNGRLSLREFLSHFRRHR